MLFSLKLSFTNSHMEKNTEIRLKKISACIGLFVKKKKIKKKKRLCFSSHNINITTPYHTMFILKKLNILLFFLIS